MVYQNRNNEKKFMAQKLLHNISKSKHKEKGGLRMLYYNPKSIEETLKLLNSFEKEDTVILAGGTDVVPKLNSRPEKSGYFNVPIMDLEKKKIIYLGNIDLKYIKEEDDSIVIGAMTTMTEILDSNIIDKLPVLKEALNVMAGVTIRNVATIGGNIMNASPAADSIPPLIALGAKAVLIGTDGERTENVEDLFEGPGKIRNGGKELLKEIVVPVKKGKASFIKFGRRKAESLSIVNGAAYAEIENTVCKEAVIVLGAVAPVPLRVSEAEEIIIGKKLTDELIEKAAEKAAEKVSPIDDKRASGDYRRKLVRTLVKRTLNNVGK